MKSFLVLASMAISLALGHIGGTDLGTQTYCGRHLARTVALLCYEYEASYDKRSNSGTVNDNIHSPYYRGDESLELSGRWLPPQHARGLYLPSRGKRIMGVENASSNPAAETNCSPTVRLLDKTMTQDIIG